MCKQELPDDCFSKDKKHKDGLNSICKECNKKYQREYRIRVKENGGKNLGQHKSKNLPLESGLRICQRCGRILPLEQFPRKKKDGIYKYRGICKDCYNSSIRKKKRGLDNSTRIKTSDTLEQAEEKMKLFEAGLKVCSICKRMLPVENFRKNKRSKCGLASCCKECNAKRDKNYYDKNKESLLQKSKEYYKNNKDRIIQHNTNWQRTRRQSDSVYDLSVRIRGFINKSFVRKNYQKTMRGEDIVGLPIKDFIEYLLKTFSDRYGREWDGVEKVHIDHIIPLVAAKTEGDIIKLNHYTNLQLLTAEDNMAKGSKLDWKK